MSEPQTPHPSTCPTACLTYNHPGREHEDWLAAIWDAAVDAAFRGAITRQNAADVKRANPYRSVRAGEGT